MIDYGDICKHSHNRFKRCKWGNLCVSTVYYFRGVWMLLLFFALAFVDSLSKWWATKSNIECLWAIQLPIVDVQFAKRCFVNQMPFFSAETLINYWAVKRLHLNSHDILTHVQHVVWRIDNISFCNLWWLLWFWDVFTLKMGREFLCGIFASFQQTAFHYLPLANVHWKMRMFKSVFILKPTCVSNLQPYGVLFGVPFRDSMIWSKDFGFLV